MLRVVKIRIRIHIEPDDGRFYAYCPELKGVHAEGESQEDALDNARDAASAYIESLMKNGDSLPLCAQETPITVSSLFGQLFRLLMPKKGTWRVEELSVGA